MRSNFVTAIGESLLLCGCRVLRLNYWNAEVFANLPDYRGATTPSVAHPMRNNYTINTLLSGDDTM